MKLRVACVVVGLLSLVVSVAAQSSSPTVAEVPPLIQFSNVAIDVNGKPLTGVIGITFSLYQEQQGGAPLWMETQNVRPDNTGHYTVLLGSTTSQGLPASIFTSGEAHWLGVQVQGQAEQPRVLLVSAPYALKAADAETIGGLPPSAFMLAAPSSANPAGNSGNADAGATLGPFVFGSGIAGFVPLWTTTALLGDSVLFQSGSGSTAVVGINTTTPAATLDVNGSINTSSAYQIGSNLFAFGSYANRNAFLGFAGNTTTSSVGNTASGAYALVNNTTGGYNTASGNDALVNNTTGSGNTGTGLFGGMTADLSNLTGQYNTALGAYAAFSTGTLTNATAIGAQAEVSESNALVLGSIGGVNSAESSTNVGIGTTTPAYRLDVHGTGNFTGLVTFAPGQTFPGTGTITGVTAGTGLSGGGTSGTVTLANTGLLSLTAGTGITSSGGQTPTIGINTSVVPQLNAANTFTGNQTVNGNMSATGVVTGSSYQIGSNLFAFGSYSNGNAFLGFAGNTTLSGLSNTGIGFGAFYANTTGSNNAGVGAGAFVANTTGYYNAGIGASVLAGNTTGAYNAGIGAAALDFNTTGSNNTAVGFNAGYLYDLSNLTGSYNTALGNGAGFSTGTLTNATAIGAQAEVSESNAMVLGEIYGVGNATASTNVGIGTTAPASTLDVEGNVAAGIAPIVWLKNDATLSQGTGNAVDIRFTPDSGGAVATPNAYIRAQEDGDGHYGTSVQFGTVAQGNSGASERMRITSAGDVGIGTTAPDTLLSVNGGADKPGGGSWGTFSDGRLKTLNGSFSSGLSQILRINPIRYRYKRDNAMGIRDSDEHIGVVAQEVQRVIPEAVTENSKGYLLVNNDPIIWTMLNAIKEQQREIRDLKSELRATRQTLQKVKAQVADAPPRLVAAK
jgi:hypothetical protein